MEDKFIKADTASGHAVYIPRVIGQMEYVRIIGSGANAVVYEARHQRTGVSYACKVFNRSDISDPAAIYCLEQEIRAGERIHNPHIVEVKETLYDENAIVLVMELCKKSLLSNLSYGYPLSVERARLLFCQMLLGVEYLHDRNITHGDIKPDNLLFDADYNVKLADFGCVNLDGANFLAGHGGTLLYMAPELLTQSREYFDHRPADIWALGIVFYAMCSGRLPWSDRCPEFIERQIKEGDLYFPEYFSADAVDIISRCCAKEPKDRPTATELLNHMYLVDQAQALREKDAQALTNSPLGGRALKASIQSSIKRIHTSKSDSRTLKRIGTIRTLLSGVGQKSVRGRRPFNSLGAISTSSLIPI